MPHQPEEKRDDAPDPTKGEDPSQRYADEALLDRLTEPLQGGFVPATKNPLRPLMTEDEFWEGFPPEMRPTDDAKPDAAG